MKNTIIGLLLFFTWISTQAQNIEGTWNGVLKINDISLRIVFHIEKNGDTYSTKMDSPDQGASGIPADKTSFDGQQLVVEAAQLGMVFTGNLNGEEVVGEFKQGPTSFPLTFSRKAVEKKVEPRPQDPKDFPYKVEEVSFKNHEAKVTLAGTLTLPKDGKPKSVVILISGSGPQDRNEEVASFNHRPFLVLSDYLTRNGIGVLRYDERGVGESSGNFGAATSADFATDVVAAIDFLNFRPDLKGVKIGLAGHSEGGIIAPMVASTSKEVDFIALLAAPGMPSGDLLLLQSKLISEAEQVPTEIVEANHKILQEAYAFLVDNVDLPKEEAKKGLIKIFKSGLTGFPKEVRSQIGNEDEFVNKEAEGLLDPWFRYFIAIDPAIYLEKVNCPVFAINGTLDLQVPATENLEAIEQSLTKAGNENFVIKPMAQLNHLFQKAETGSPSEYKNIEETFNEAAMKAIASWINQQ